MKIKKKLLINITLLLLLLVGLTGTALASGTLPLLDIRKQAEGFDSRTVAYGSDVTFDIVVTNNSGVDTFLIKVEDVLAPGCEAINISLAPGASYNISCTIENVTEDFTNEACVYAWNEGDWRGPKDCDPSEVLVEPPPPGGGQGCTPGYWKQSQHFDSWVNYTPPGPDYETFFGVNASFQKDFLGALGQGGGGQKALGRHATAAILNANNPNVSYFYTQADVIALVQSAYASGDFEGVKNMLEYQNELGCPLN